MTEQLTKHFVDANGRYIGAFVGAEPPAGAIEVTEPPQDVSQVWTGASWSEPSVQSLGPISKAQLLDVLLDRDVYEADVIALLENADYSQATDPIKAKARALNAFKNATEYRPDHPMVAALRPALGLADEADFAATWREAEKRVV